jgi:hypothetical protein
MSDAQDYRTKAAEFARLASKATSLKDIREFRHRAQAFRSLAEHKEWVVANRDKLIFRPSARRRTDRARERRRSSITVHAIFGDGENVSDRT